eukprot:445288-Amorphochlora_amoeboformis.AAC.1
MAVGPEKTIGKPRARASGRGRWGSMVAPAAILIRRFRKPIFYNSLVPNPRTSRRVTVFSAALSYTGTCHTIQVYYTT